jgi:hypothetical protein
MSYITLEQAKQHLLVDMDYKADDLYILDLITVAEDSVKQHLNIGLLSELETGGSLPPVIIHAMLLMIGNLYANREPVAFATAIKVPLSYEYLLGLYKQYDVK